MSTPTTYIEAVEATIRDLLLAPRPELEPLYGMLRYHLGWADEALRPVQAASGKRVRPLLCLLACQAAGGEWQRAVPVAAGVELIHNFSLIHDDIEDGSRTRRHRPTVWALWGAPQAVNAGDSMFILARLAVLQLRQTGASPDVVAAAIEQVEQACLRLCEGQYLDMAFEQQAQVPLAAYMRMIEGKTAALLACATATGALVGGASAASQAAFRRFGNELGLAFQIVDDILGAWGDPAVTGKPAADDIRSHKKAFPLLYALEVSAERGDGRLASLMAQPQLSEGDVARVLALIDEMGARERANALAVEHTDRALAALTEAAPPSPEREALRELALKLVERNA